MYDEQPWIAERIEQLWHDTRVLNTLSPYAAINFIRRGIGYDDYIADYADYRNVNKDDLYDVADEILSNAKGYRTLEEWYTHIENYKKELEELKQEKYTLIFYESPYRVRETLELIYEIFGDRQVSVSREISKKYEEVYRGKINEVLEELVEPKGEFVIIVEGNTKKETYDDIDILSHVKKLIDEGYTEKEAIKKVAKLHNLEKNVVYMEYHGGK